MNAVRPTSLALAALVAIPLLAPAAARADAAAPAHGRTAMLEIEVSDVAAQRTRAARFTVAVEYGRTAEVEIDSGGARFKVGMRLEASPRGGLLALDLQRIDRAPDNNVGLTLNAALPANKRTVLASLERADGSRLEVAATLR